MLAWTTYLQYTGLAGFFASRAFLSAFTFAMIARYGADIPIINGLTLIINMGNTPEWFTHDITLVVLGTLATMEILSEKIPEVREFMSTFDSYLKAIMAAITSMGIISTTDVGFINGVIESGSGAWIFAMLSGAFVFGLASIRSQFLNLLRESDSEDAIGIQKLISWAEDIYAFLGPLIFLIFPLATTLIIVGIFSLIAWWSKKQVLKEEKRKIKCSSCGEDIFRHSHKCFKCSKQNASMHDVNTFGFSKNTFNDIPETQPIKLVSTGRCPTCASILDTKKKEQQCPCCNDPIFENKILLENFLANQRSRLPIALALCAIFSLVPVIGLIPGIIFYRLYLVAPFRRYLPATQSFVLRWGLRLFIFFLMAIQMIPAVGIIVVPLMAWINFESYRAAFANRYRATTHDLTGSGSSPVLESA